MKKIVIFDSTGSLKDIRKTLRESLYVPGMNIGFDTGILKKISNKFLKALRILPALFEEKIIVSDAISMVQLKLSDEFVFLNHGWGTKFTPPRWKWKDPSTYEHFRIFLEKKPKIICLSDFDRTYFLRAPGLDPSSAVFVPLGHPRNDYLVRNSRNHEIRSRILEKFSISEKSTVVLYAPTHREFRDINEKVYEKIISELEDIDPYLDEKNIFILFRPHYYVEGMKSSFKRFKNIRYVGVDITRDARDLMISSDILLTDYSSIYVDYLLLEKPVVFYPFDLEEYHLLRGLPIDFENLVHTPGPKLTKLKDLIDAVHDLSYYSDHLKSAKKHFHKYHDDGATNRVIEFIINLAEG